VLVHINTFLVQQVLPTRPGPGAFTAEDRRALSALFWRHVNRCGTLSLDMDDDLYLAVVMPAADAT
jgi:hypothetical protein